MKTAIVIPSLGRAAILGEGLRQIAKQVKMPHQVVVVVASQEDLPDEIPDYVAVVFSEKGTCVQRNVGIDNCDDEVDFILFIDDDTFLHPSYIEEMERIFSGNPDIAALSGRLLCDGNISIDEAVALLQDYVCESDPLLIDAGLYGSYGIRKSILTEVRYDERLVLYGFLEDADLASHIRKKGPIKGSSSLVAVHLGYVSGGRANHVRFGFSQVMNPFYLCRKNGKSFPLYEMLSRHWFRGVPANLVGIITGPDRKDRMDRFKGNMIAFGLLLTGRVMPEHATKL